MSPIFATEWHQNDHHLYNVGPFVVVPSITTVDLYARPFHRCLRNYMNKRCILLLLLLNRHQGSKVCTIICFKSHRHHYRQSHLCIATEPPNQIAIPNCRTVCSCNRQSVSVAFARPPFSSINKNMYLHQRVFQYQIRYRPALHYAS